jgi:hypothetical protein
MITGVTPDTTQEMTYNRCDGDGRTSGMQPAAETAAKLAKTATAQIMTQSRDFRQNNDKSSTMQLAHGCVTSVVIISSTTC